MSTQPETSAPTPTPLVVRDATADDLPAVAAIFTHFTLRTTVTVSTEVRTPREWLDRYEGQIRNGPYHLLVAERDGAVVGYVESQQFRPKPAYDRTVELSIYVAPDRGRGGVGSALYGALFARLAAEGRMHRAVAIVTIPNDASVAFHLAQGFVHRGTLDEVAYKFGRYLDIAYFERTL
jgi:phosphinothricin acetyltransferase